MEGRPAFGLNSGAHVVLSHREGPVCFYSREPRGKEAGSTVLEAGGVARGWAGVTGSSLDQGRGFPGAITLHTSERI